MHAVHAPRRSDEDHQGCIRVATLLNGKVVGIQTLLSEGDTVDGLTLNSFKLNDPMSAKGLVVVRAETSGGAAFIRLTPTWPS